MQQGFQRSENEPMLYKGMKRSNGEMVLLSLYVYGVIHMGSIESITNDFKRGMMRAFEMSRAFALFSRAKNHAR